MTIHDLKINILVLGPLIIPFSALPIVGFGGAHLTVFRVYLLVVFFVYFAEALLSSRVNKLHRLEYIVTFCLLVYLFLLALSVFWSEDYVRSLSYVVFFASFSCFVFVFLQSRMTKEYVFRLVDVWILASLFVGVICYFEIFHGYRPPGSRYFEEEVVSYLRPTATFWNENNLALYLFISSMFVFWRARFSRLIIRYFLYIIIFYFLFIIIMTESRAALLLWLFSLMLSFLFFNRLSVLVIFNYVVFLIGGLLLLFYFDFYRYFEASISGLHLALSKGDARTELLSIAASAMSENFYFGVGAGGIERYAAQFDTVRVNSIHNWIGEVSANTGILGFIIWGVMLGAIYIRFFEKFSVGDDLFKILFIIFLLFPLWQSVASSMIQFTVFWFLLALIVKYISVVNRDGIGREHG